MSAKVTHFLKALRNRTAVDIAAELRRMGVYIKEKAQREELMKAIDTLDLHKVERHLLKLEAVPAAVVPKVKVKAVHEALLLPPELAALRESLIQIHQKYLNQFGKPQTPVSQQWAEAERRSSVDEVNDLLGVTPEIRLDPKSVIHQYENDSTTLIQKIFPTLSEKEYQQRLTKHRLGLRFIDTPTTAQQKLLMAYGIERQKQFFKSSIDFIQELLYPNKPIKQRVTKQYEPAALAKGFLFTFPQRQQYYLAVIASLSLVQLYRFITLINSYLHSMAVASAIHHYFSLTVAQSIISKSSILRTSPLTINGKSILEWIGRSIKDFRTYLQSSEIDRPSVNTLLITLKRYSSIRKIFKQHIDQLPEQVLLQASQREWIEPLMLKLETVVDEVSVGELGGRRVAEKLQIIKTLIAFAANEQVELSQAFLQKLLVSIRNGLDALIGDEQSRQQSWLFVSEKQRFFGWEVVHDIIKVMFINAEATINVVPVLSFLWSRFYRIATLEELSIQSLFLLINVTARYKCEGIVHKQESAVFDLLSRSLEAIARENYQQLRKKEVIDFLKEEAVLLLENANREALLQQISVHLEQK